MKWTRRDKLRLLRDGALLVIGLGLMIGDYILGDR
jgi:hypothetical protein